MKKCILSLFLGLVFASVSNAQAPPVSFDVNVWAGETNEGLLTDFFYQMQADVTQPGGNVRWAIQCAGSEKIWALPPQLPGGPPPVPVPAWMPFGKTPWDIMDIDTQVLQQHCAQADVRKFLEFVCVAQKQQSVEGVWQNVGGTVIVDTKGFLIEVIGGVGEVFELY